MYDLKQGFVVLCLTESWLLLQDACIIMNCCVEWLMLWIHTVFNWCNHMSKVNVLSLVKCKPLSFLQPVLPTCTCEEGFWKLPCIELAVNITSLHFLHLLLMSYFSYYNALLLQKDMTNILLSLLMSAFLLCSLSWFLHLCVSSLLRRLSSVGNKNDVVLFFTSLPPCSVMSNFSSQLDSGSLNSILGRCHGFQVLLHYVNSA